MALKTTIAAGLVAFTMALLPATAADAKTTVNIGIGNGGWVGTCWSKHGRRCGWRAHPGYFRYAPRHRAGVFFAPRHRAGVFYAPRHRAGVYYNFGYGYGNVYSRPYRGPVSHRMTCGAARNLVDHSGFSSVRARECAGKIYTFKARRHGRNFVVKVNANSRRIIGVGRN